MSSNFEDIFKEKFRAKFELPICLPIEISQDKIDSEFKIRIRIYDRFNVISPKHAGLHEVEIYFSMRTNDAMSSFQIFSTGKEDWTNPYWMKPEELKTCLTNKMIQYKRYKFVSRLEKL